MESLEHIEEYFKGSLDGDKKREFEESIRNDPAFANEVAYYLSVTQAAKEITQEERLSQFRTMESGRSPVAGKVVPFRKYWMIAAACAAIAISVLVLNLQSSLSRDARRYVNTHFETVGTLMSGAADVTQQGIDAYNHQEYAAARDHFRKALSIQPGNSQVLQLAGLASLQLKDYSEAISDFRNLASLPGLYSNPGKFLQAVTLLSRDHGSDEDEAKKLLQSVVNEKLYGIEEAARWLKKLD